MLRHRHRVAGVVTFVLMLVFAFAGQNWPKTPPVEPQAKPMRISLAQPAAQPTRPTAKPVQSKPAPVEKPHEQVQQRPPKTKPPSSVAESRQALPKPVAPARPDMRPAPSPARPPEAVSTPQTMPAVPAPVPAAPAPTQQALPAQTPVPAMPAPPKPSPAPPRNTVATEAPPKQASRNEAAHYTARLRSYLESIKRYPTSKEARLQRPTGSVELWFVLNRQGELQDVGIENSSGSMILDDAAKYTARRGQYPPFPEDAWPGQATHRFTVTLDYSIQ